MSYSADERLPEDYFKGVMEEKVEMLRKYLKYMDDALIFSAHCGHTMATLKFYSYNEEDSLKLHSQTTCIIYFLKFRGFGGLVVLLICTTQLCVKRRIIVILKITHYFI